MIVIATHNGKDYLPGLLHSFQEFGTAGHKVLVMDTGSNCNESVALLDEIQDQSWSFDLEVDRTPYKGYDSGAYIYAYKNHPCDSYLFLQDSILVKHPGWIEAFESRATYGVGCVPWLTFPSQWNSQEQVDWLMESYATNQWAPFGIFGPIFYAKREALSDLDRNGYLNVIPTTKLEQMGMERGWSTAFILSGWAVRPIETAFEERSLRGDKFTHLKKRFALRN